MDRAAPWDGPCRLRRQAFLRRLPGGRHRLDLRDADLGGSPVAEPQLGGSGLAEIDDAASMIGPAVIDRHLDGFPRPLIDHVHHGPEREGLMRRGHGILVEPLSRGRLVAVEAGAIPGCTPTLIAARVS